MFDITPEHIERLSDGLLRELVARLCEAEIRAGQMSPLAVTWGGDQNSADGGIDVRVSLAIPLPSRSNLPRSNCGFQVKAQDMPRADILAEMMPAGALRPAIRALAAASGAYIVVSSKGSVSDTALTNRLEAMREAIQRDPNAGSLHFDFYDRTRLATWVRDHPGLVLWVREVVGISISGWKPYGDWSHSHEGLNGAYLLDDTLRVQGSSANSSAKDGISEIRERLTKPGGIIRLVGLSGTGKTRFVQALFDDRIDTNALPPSLAVYANISDDPRPQPVALASELAAQAKRAVLIVDNCPPDLHRNLAAVCKNPQGVLSLITVEYDVHEDQPEGTDVFELQPASDDLVKRLLQSRYTSMSHVNVDAIAECSGGNARVALALAQTVTPAESLTELRDADLFHRLFQQRRGEDRSLLRSAQACSLVYSFQGEDTSHEDGAELWRLTGVMGIEPRTFYEDLVRLQQRDLLQKRGAWRALLPHAIANRLAVSALASVPSVDIQRFYEQLSPRLLRSFSRRLSYLHKSEQAQNIVARWLAPDGLLGQVESLNDVMTAVLVNIAPVAPTAVLEAISRANKSEKAHGRILRGEEFRVLLRSLAFDAELFDQAFFLLVDLIENEEPSRYANNLRNDVSSMFHLFLSGNHATIKQRIAAIELLLDSGTGPRREIGYACLGAMLQTPPFTSFQRFEFGARPRDYGYQPRTQQDISDWFSEALKLCDRFDVRDQDASQRIRKILSDRLWGMWTDAGTYDEIEALCKSFADRRYWPEGWIAIRSLRGFREEPLPPDQDERLRRIEGILRPRSIQEQVRVYVLRRPGSAWDDLGYNNWSAQLERLYNLSVELGRSVGRDDAVFDELLPELVRLGGNMSIGAFAKGIVESGAPPEDIWRRASRSFATADPKERNVEFLACIVSSLASMKADTEQLLTNSFTDPDLKPFYPYLQSRVRTTEDGMARLTRCLADHSVPIEHYRGLGFNRQMIDDGQLASLIPLMAIRPGGFPVALDCTWMRLAMCERNDEPPVSEAIISAGRKLLTDHAFSRNEHFEHYHYREVAKNCLAGTGGAEAVRMILHRLQSAASPRFDVNFHDAGAVMDALITVQPVAALDAIVASRSNEHRTGLEQLLDWHDSSTLDHVPEPILLQWCELDPDYRFPWAASHVRFFTKADASEEWRWKSTARSLLERAPDSIAVMKRYIKQLEPRTWTGSRAATWRANLILLDHFDANGNAKLKNFVAEERGRLILHVAQVQVQEDAEERRGNERFE